MPGGQASGLHYWSKSLYLPGGREVCDGLSFHVISSPEYIAQVIRPNIAKGAEKAGRSPKDINVHGTGFVITGPDQKTVEAEREVVRNRLAFYFSTSTYHPVLEVHGFQDIGPVCTTSLWRKMGRHGRVDYRRNDRCLFRIRGL